jgi:transmembrane sensor
MQNLSRMEQWDMLIVKCLAGQCTSEEMQKLNHWRQADKRNDGYFEKCKALWSAGELNTITFNPDVQQALYKIQTRIETHEHATVALPRLNFFYYAKRVAAILLIGTCIGIAIYRQTGGAASVDITEVTTDKNSKINLSDGSTIWLNTNSKMNHPQEFPSDKREVFLEGEGYFEVSKDSLRPFIIHAGNSTTRVIGTSFNVCSQPNENNIVVTVTSGKVTVYASTNTNTSVILVKGERAVMNKKSLHIVKEINDDKNFMAWKTGKVIFEDTPFAAVARVLSIHYKKEIVVDKALLNCRLTSVFDNQSLAEVMEELKAMHALQIQNNGDSIIITGEGCQ